MAPLTERALRIEASLFKAALQGSVQQIARKNRNVLQKIRKYVMIISNRKKGLGIGEKRGQEAS